MVARTEQIQADEQAKQIRTMGSISIERGIGSVPLGTMAHALKLDPSPERFECEPLVPIMIQAAEVKNHPHAVMEFAKTNEASTPSWELFDGAINHLGNTPKVNYWIRPACEYIVTSDMTGNVRLLDKRKRRLKHPVFADLR